MPGQLMHQIRFPSQFLALGYPTQPSRTSLCSRLELEPGALDVTAWQTRDDIVAIQQQTFKLISEGRGSTTTVTMKVLASVQLHFQF